MKKLLQINTTLNVGSTGRIAEQIAGLATAHGWDCYMAHGGRYVNKSGFKTIPIGGKWDNYIHAALGEFLGRHGFGSYFATRRFVKKVKEIQPDVIHLHNVHGYYLNLPVLFGYLAESGIPVVWTLHDCWTFTGHCTHFEADGCYKWKKECGNCQLLMAQYKSRFVDRSKKNFRIKKSLYAMQKHLTIVPVSNWLGGLLPDSILGQYPVRVIRNGIDLEVFKPMVSDIKARLGISPEKKMVLGVMFAFKGKDEFLRLSQDERYQVVLVGLSDAVSRQLPSNIIGIARTNSQQELAEYYAAADVFLNPTYNDTFPTTNIEALACGTPVVTYQSGGSPEIIDDNTGIAVPRGDYQALVRALETVLEKGKAYYSAHCRNRAVQLFNKDARFMDYIQLYEELRKKSQA